MFVPHPRADSGGAGGGSDGPGPVAATLRTEFRGLGNVCPLGLASRGDTRLEPDDVLAAIDRGVDYLNWCGQPDGMSAAVRRLGDRRRDGRIAVQLASRTADAARRELRDILGELGAGAIDIVTRGARGTLSARRTRSPRSSRSRPSTG